MNWLWGSLSGLVKAPSGILWKTSKDWGYLIYRILDAGTCSSLKFLLQPHQQVYKQALADYVRNVAEGIPTLELVGGWTRSILSPLPA